MHLDKLKVKLSICPIDIFYPDENVSANNLFTNQQITIITNFLFFHHQPEYLFR